MIRAVVDVNVIVSALLSSRGAPWQVLEAWRDGAFSVVIAEGIIAEVVEKLRSPRIGGAYGVTDEDVAWVVALLRSQAEQVTLVPGDVRATTGDPEDDYVLATGRLAQADVLVTGDKRLLSLAEHEGTRIISPSEFVELLRSS